jgi:hypothetical protein
MKLRTIFITTLFAASGYGFINCSGDKKESTGMSDTITSENAETHEHEADVTRTEAGKPEFTVDEVFQKQVQQVFASYVSLKDAFVSSEAGKVKDEAKKTAESLGKVDMKLVSGPAHNDWMVYEGEMKSALNNIREASDIEQQREFFSKLSYSLYKTIKAYGLGGATAYYEFCPMAFNDKGAYWLSDNSKIRNPYFGDKMLTCGSVEETLQ